MSNAGGSEQIHSESAKVEPIEPGQTPNARAVPPPPRANSLIREIMSGSAVLTVLAVVLGLAVAAILIIVTDSRVNAAAAYFFARPSDLFIAAGQAVGSAYVALFQGAILDTSATDVWDFVKPLTDSLSFAAPLIVAGLGVALAFRVGMFNIGGQGQILIAGATAGWVAWSFPMPPVVAFLVATVAGVAGGALWGGIVGFLKARTGAHEVILTIMLNYIAVNIIAFGLRFPELLRNPSNSNPRSPAIPDPAQYPDLLGFLGVHSKLNVGFLIAILATVLVWYLFSRSATGFRFRAVGENPNAARVAGIDVKWVYLLAMILAGGLVGLAGADFVLGPDKGGFTGTFDAGLGFDAITVALLGRSRPWGVFFSGLLFGALQAGGYRMQALEQAVPLDIVLVIQSVIVLFLAAPPLVRTVFRLPRPGSTPKPRKRRPVAEGAAQ